MAFENFDRSAGIGGSDVPAILGVSPWATITDVWLEKTHHPAWRPKKQTEEMRWGTLLEPVMRLAYEQDRNLHVYAPGEKTYWAADHIGYAHLDGLVEGEGIWEGKFPINTWRNWADGVPVYVQAQIQWYMSIVQEPWCDVSALLPGADFQTWRVPADPATQDHIATVVDRFWRENVLTGDPPEPLPARLAYPTHKSDLMVVADQEAELLVTRLQLAKTSGSLEARAEEEIKEQLKLLIGAAAGMTGYGWRIRYKRNRDSEKTDWKLVAGVWRKQLEELQDVGHSVVSDLPPTHPEHDNLLRLLTDAPPADTVIGLYTTVSDGARPFVLEFEEDK